MSYGATPSKEQAKLIDELGGPTAVIKAVNERLGTNHSSQMVSMWRLRGIPYRYRGILSVLAQEKGVKTPADFFGVTGVA